jgi:microcystin-dependent protein
MTFRLRHLFQSAKGDGPDSTLVRPSDWNADHDLETDSTTPLVIGRQSPGAGPLEELPLNVLFPSGICVPFAGAVAPVGWLLCYGQAVNQADFPSLYAAIGTTYGAGPGPATFVIPDLRGVVIGGKSNMGGADRGNLPSGGTLGNYTGAWYSATGGFNMSGTNNLNFGNLPLQGGYAQPSGAEVAAANSGNGASFVAHDHAVQGFVSVDGNFGINVSGASGNFNVVQPTVIMNTIIKT